jgi:hypothetical protein
MDNEWRSIWEQIVKIHFATKRITLHAEELEYLGNKTYLQPIREERDAFEHVCRAIGSDLGLAKLPRNHDYIAGNLESARKHVVRAFFDAADWYGTVLRAGIRERLEPYSQQCIRSVLPQYYSEMQVRIDAIVHRVVQCREEKDASDQAGTYEEVVVYGNLVAELEEIYRKVWTSVPYLEDLRQKENAQQLAEKKESQRIRWLERPWSLAISFIAGLLILAVTAISGCLVGRSFAPDNPHPEEAAPASTIKAHPRFPYLETKSYKYRCLFSIAGWP